MRKKLRTNDSVTLLNSIVHGIQEKKGHNIISLDLTNIKNSISDYFIVCHGDSTTQVGAIADSVIETVRAELGEKAWHSEGYQNSEWILIDFVSVVVHVFLKDKRYFYNIEGLWADAGRKEYDIQA